MTHWCRDIPRDEAVRAAEDGREGPLPTLADVIAEPFADSAKCSPAVSKTGEWQSGLRTERVTLEITHSVPVAGWDWTNILETYRPGESVRVVEESAPSASGAANSPAAPVSAEPVTWGVKLPGHEPFGQDAVWSVRPSEELAKEVFPSSEGWVHFPLFAAPQPASSWLTEEERELLSSLADAWERRAAELERPGTWGSGLPSSKSLRSEAAMLRDLLARSSPPEVGK